MKKLHLINLNLTKEEMWINKYIKKGYRLSKVDVMWHIFNFEPREYSEQEQANNIGIVKIDFHNFTEKEDFEEYVTLFEDSGWKLIDGSERLNYCFFEKNRQDATEDIFSDNASSAERYKRILLHLFIVLGIYSPFLFMFLSETSISDMVNPRQCFCTPGLWEMSGISFWSAFLCELPYVLLDVYGLLPIFLCGLYLIFMIARVYFLYQKTTEVQA